MDISDILYILRTSASRGLFAGGCAGAILGLPMFLIVALTGILSNELIGFVSGLLIGFIVEIFVGLVVGLICCVIGLSIGFVLAIFTRMFFSELLTFEAERMYRYMAYFIVASSGGISMRLLIGTQGTILLLETAFLTILSMLFVCWIARDPIQQHITNQRFNRKQRYYLKHMNRL